MKVIGRIAAIALLMLFSSTAYGVDYWPTIPDVTTNFELILEGEPIPLTLTFAPTWFATDEMMIGRKIYLTVDASGDVYFEGMSRYWEKKSGSEDLTFSTPVLFLDLPLWAGKSWETSFLEDETDPLSEVLCRHEVVEATEVTVGAGTFDVMVVQVSVTPTYSYTPRFPGGAYYLHETLGPVIFPGGFSLVSYSGVVETEECLWGGVKALYR